MSFLKPVLAEENIAYIRLTGNYWQAWVTDPKGIKHEQITDDTVDVTRVSWFPDRKSILVNRADGSILKANVITKKTDTIELESENVFDAQVSNNGNQIVFSRISANKRDNNNIWLTDIKNNKLKKLTNQPELQMTPSWGYGDNVIVYTAGKAIDKHEIWKLDLKTGSQYLIPTSGIGYKFDPVVNKNGDILYSHNREGNYDIWIFEQKNKKSRKITNTPGYEGDISWSRDAKKIVYVEINKGNRKLIVHDLQNEEKFELLNSAVKVRSPAWAK